MLLPLALAYARKYWKAGLVVVALLVVATTVAYVRHLQHERDEMLIDKNNAEALADTLKVKYSNDSIVVVGILASTRRQLLTMRDSLKLAGKSKTVTNIVVALDSSHHEHSGGPIRDSVLTDSIVGPPTDIRVAARLRAMGTADWTWDVRPHPVRLTIDVGCLDKYKPDVNVRGPAWARVEAVQTEVAREVCGDKQKNSHGMGWYAVRAGLVVGSWVAGRAKVPF
jgi:hypothetical protein